MTNAVTEIESQLLDAAIAGVVAPPPAAGFAARQPRQMRVFADYPKNYLGNLLGKCF